MAYVLLCSILPGFLLAPLLGIGLPVSALVGAYYAWEYNQNGGRVSLKDAAVKKLKK